ISPGENGTNQAALDGGNPREVTIPEEGGICSGTADWSINPFTSIKKALCSVAIGLIFAPLTFASWLLYTAGWFLDYVVDYTVVDIAKNINDLTGINIAWSVIRDLINISFIFILLY